MNEKDEKDEKSDVDLASFNTARKVNSSEYRQSYNAKRDRSKYDDVQKRKAFKEEQYGNKKTIKDPYTGKDLHRNGNAALNKYGEKHVNEHKSQTDHTISLEKVVNKNKNNTFLSDEDIKEIANIQENYKEINANLNQSKGSKSNVETAKKNNVSNQQKKKMTEEQIKAQAAVDRKTVEKTIENANKLGVEAAKSGAIMGAGMSAVQNIDAVINGEEELPEAILNVGIDTAKAAASSYGTAIAVKSAESLTKTVGEEVIKKTEKTALKVAGEKIGGKLIALDAGVIGQVASITCEVGASVKKYLQGDISAGELINELGEKGTGMAASLYGGVIGLCVGSAVGLPIIGEMVGNMVGYFIGTTIYNSVQKFFDKISDCEANIARYNEMAEQISLYRQKLEEEFEILNAQNRKVIKESFEGMSQAILNDNMAAFNESLNDVCKVYGTEVEFKSINEFEDFWNNPDMILEI